MTEKQVFYDTLCAAAKLSQNDLLKDTENPVGKG
jgi:hypothetical protein